MPEDDRLDLATARARSQRFFWGWVIVQCLAIIVGGLYFLQTREIWILMAVFAIAPLAAVGFGLLTLYQFMVIQGQKME